MTIRRSLAALLLLVPVGAAAQETACSAFPHSGASYACTCAAGRDPGPVWGSGPYTADSDICTAARHAGAIGPEGGAVVAEAAPAPGSYDATAANGVTTLPYGPYDRAYVIRGGTLGAGLPACGALAPMTETTCGCPAGPYGGAVWGSDPYTDDSDVCMAALHAGVIGPEGGEVTVRRVAGEAGYEGSTRNGVTSNPYGAWGASFTFGAKD